MQPVNSPHSPYGMCRTVMKVSLSYFEYHNHNHNRPILNIFIIKKNTSNLSFCRTPCLGNTQMLASTLLLPHLATPRIRKLWVNLLCLCMFVSVCSCVFECFSPCVYLGWPMFSVDINTSYRAWLSVCSRILCVHFIQKTSSPISSSLISSLSSPSSSSSLLFRYTHSSPPERIDYLMYRAQNHLNVKVTTYSIYHIP